MPSRLLLNSIQNSINKFVLEKLNVSKNRVNLKTTAGGLGLFDLEEFLMSQQATWIFKAENSCRDIWRARIHENSFGNPMCTYSDTYNSIRNPVLYGLALSFQNFRKVFDSKNDNFHQAFILNNSLFFRSRADRRFLTATSLNISTQQARSLSKVIFSECFNEDGFKTKNELSADFDFELTQDANNLISDCLMKI
jgi:hypothetical protein